MRREELSLPQPPANDRPGDRWVCGRAGSQAPCARGPGPKGICPNDSPCQPQRTWHGRRKLISTTALVILVVVLVLVCSNQYSAIVFKPGDLATPHAQILSGTWTSSRCSACHPQAGESPLQWFTTGSLGHEGVSQTDRCLDCHHATIAPETARLAHNLPYRLRADLRLASLRPTEQSWHDLLPGPAVDQEDLQCSTCHQEHRGADGDLLAISDSQCQTCHSDRFGSFASSHPDWSEWPYGRGQEISFNHATHANQHFPATARGLGVAKFQCVNCHQRTADNELTRSTSYEQACKSCHDQPLRVAVAEGIDLIALPTLSTAAARQVQPWPEAATGFFDGKVAPFAELLLRTDREAMVALGQIPGRDLANLDPESDEHRAAAQIIARAYRRLVQQIAEQGQQAIIDRLVIYEMDPATLSALVQSLSPQLVESANRRWFDDSPAKSARAQPTDELRTVQFRRQASGSDALLPADAGGDGDLLGGQPLPSDALGFDPLAEDPLAVRDNPATDSTGRFEADQMMPAGGWYRDDIRLAIRYRAGGHDDPLLRSMIEWISRLPNDDVARQQLLKSPAVAACISCHQGAITAGSWQSHPLIGRRSEFTKFTHSPHLNVAQLADCQHCHQVDGQAGDRLEVTLTSGVSATLDFEPLGRHACAGCHTAKAAGDACTKCHRYHIDLR